MWVPNDLVRTVADALKIGAERTVVSLIQFGRAGADLISEIRARFPSMPSQSVRALINYGSRLFQSVATARSAPGNSIIKPPDGPANPYLPKGITYLLAVPYRTVSGTEGKTLVQVFSSEPIGKVAIYKEARRDFETDYVKYLREHGEAPEALEFVGVPSIISIQLGSKTE